MWKHVQRFVIVLGTIGVPLGGVSMWVAGNSIPKFIKDADGNFGTNLKWLGWRDPPQGLASSAADHWIYLGGTVILALSLISLLVVFIWHHFAPTPKVHTPISAADLAVATRAPAHEVSLTEAALYAATGKWGMIAGKEHFSTNEQRIAAGNGVANWLSDFEQKASDGKVRAWGKPLETPSSPFVEIDAMHWRTHEAYPIGVALGQPSTRQRGSLLKGNGFTDIRVSRAEFEREWPHAG